MYVCMYLDTHAITSNEKQVMNINDIRERYMGVFEGRKGRAMLQFSYKLTKKFILLLSMHSYSQGSSFQSVLFKSYCVYRYELWSVFQRLSIVVPHFCLTKYQICMGVSVLGCICTNVYMCNLCVYSVCMSV